MEDRLRILQMVREGKITPEDGLHLLDELESAPRDVSRTVRVLVRDAGGRKIQLALPVGLASSIGAMIPQNLKAKLAERGVQLDELLKAVQAGTARGPVVDVRDPGGTVVEVIVE